MLNYAFYNIKNFLITFIGATHFRVPEQLYQNLCWPYRLILQRSFVSEARATDKHASKTSTVVYISNSSNDHVHDYENNDSLDKKDETKPTHFIRNQANSPTVWQHEARRS